MLLQLEEGHGLHACLRSYAVRIGEWASVGAKGREQGEEQVAGGGEGRGTAGLGLGIGLGMRLGLGLRLELGVEEAQG